MFDSLVSSSSTSLRKDVEFLVGDVSDSAVIGVIESIQPDIVVHAAAQASVPRSMNDPQFDWRVNVLGTSNVIEGTRRLKGSRLVFLSTGGAIYGDTVEPSSELYSVPQPKSYYGVHKYVAEKYIEMSGISYGIARLANVYGPGQRSDLEGGVAAIISERLRNRQSIQIFGDGEQTRDFVHVWDVAEAISAIAAVTDNGVWNVGSGTETSINELLAQMEAVFGGATIVSYAPRRVGDVRRSVFSIDRIKADLGWSPRVTLEEGVLSLVPRVLEDLT